MQFCGKQVNDKTILRAIEILTTHVSVRMELQDCKRELRDIDTASVAMTTGATADTYSSPFVKAAAADFSDTACKRFQEELTLSADYSAKVIAPNLVHVFRVDRPDLFRVVSKEPGSECWRCDCLDDRTWLMPDRHVLATLRLVCRDSLFSPKYFGDRWRRTLSPPETLTSVYSSTDGTLPSFFKEIATSGLNDEDVPMQPADLSSQKEPTLPLVSSQPRKSTSVRHNELMKLASQVATNAMKSGYETYAFTKSVLSFLNEKCKASSDVPVVARQLIAFMEIPEAIEGSEGEVSADNPDSCNSDLDLAEMIG